MARRSSARLRNQQNSATPKRVSLSHDVDAPITRTPRTLPTKLTSLQESDEMPGAFPDSPNNSMSVLLNTAPPKNMNRPPAATPTRETPIKPAAEEMHPQLHHQTTAKPREEARHLGFSNLAPHTEPPKQTSRIAALQATPTKARDLSEDVKSPSWQFTFRREHSLELSPEAKRLMEDKREEAAKIREQMIANGESMPSIEQALEARRIVKPKGRFSQAHSQVFDKMKSIAAHPSAFRAKPTNGPALSTEDQKSAKSLKRKLSKADLDQSSSASSSRPLSREGAHLRPEGFKSQLSRSASTKNLNGQAVDGLCSPMKRVKRTEADDASTTRPPASDEEKPLLTTPQGSSRSKSAKLSYLMTPTQASLARSASLKAINGSKIPAPSFTPVKEAPGRLKTQQDRADGASPALLARSPTKSVMASVKPANASSVRIKLQQTKADEASPALLARSPSKPSTKTTKSTQEMTAVVTSPLLARAPLKAPLPKIRSEIAGSLIGSEAKTSALLARSPVKAALGKIPENYKSESNVSTIPLLGRSPSKLPLAAESNETPDKGASGKLMGRFNMLRQTPMKSILRSPQRLFSDDPAKVAAGTHFATPPKITAATNKAVPTAQPATAPVRKHVDFTSSTKAREGKAQSSTPSKTPTPSPKADRAVAASEKAEGVSYPDLTQDMSLLSPSPQKRRQTSGPGDFTFRAGDHSIIFGSPAALNGSSKTPSTIRVVSADQAPAIAQVTGSKKRKFDFENIATSATLSEGVDMSDKENTEMSVRDEADTEDREEDQRPVKRVKQSTSEQKSSKVPSVSAAPASAARRTTLGVKAKGARTNSPTKRSNPISQARLNALSQPKRR